MKIKELLAKKGHKVVTVPPTATVSTVIHRLRLERVGCVVISKDGKHCEGIVAVRDIVYALAEHEEQIRKAAGADILDVPIERVMTHTVRTCTPDDTLHNVMLDMNKRHILHVPVLEHGVMVGIVSIDDVVKFAVEEMDLERDVLRDRVSHLGTTRQLG